jgi:transposase
MQPVSCAGCQALQRRLRDLQAENERLRRQLDEATRASKRQAAPFAKGPPAGQPNAELAIRFGVILRKVWGGSRTWAGARAQSILMSVWRTCWQQQRSALDFLSQLLCGQPLALAQPR